MQTKKGYIYIITNQKNGTLYTGVTSNLSQRIYQHKNKLIEGFSCKYGLDKIVYFEEYPNIQDAIFREKQIKGGSRKSKIKLIESINPERLDLFEDIVEK